jgi:PTS system mannose-specific IIA component
VRKEPTIVNTLILTQGHLADELLAAARKIVGENCPMAALSVGWEDDFEVVSGKLRAAIEDLGIGRDGLLILTDIYGGTPHNVALKMRQKGRVEVVSGVNLPMVVRLGCGSHSERSLEEMAAWIGGKARASICCGDKPRDGDHGGA